MLTPHKKVTPFLWFDKQAEEAANFYVSIFPRARVLEVDRYGLSWQIVPKALGQLLGDPDAGRAGRAMKAMMKMGKIDIAELQRAAAG